MVILYYKYIQEVLSSFYSIFTLWNGQDFLKIQYKKNISLHMDSRILVQYEITAYFLTASIKKMQDILLNKIHLSTKIRTESDSNASSWK